MPNQSSMTSVLAEAPSQVRTFLIADVRGYTRFTLEQGDEAAAKLATRFAELSTEAVEAHEGQVTELRGDEALAVFTSARQALRASVDLQDRFVVESEDSLLPLKVGIGLDSGEAIAVAGGHRGAALNLAARLCALAGPGEVLASDTVANLARRIEGIEYAERGMVRLKGFSDPVRVVEVHSAAADSMEPRTKEDSADAASTEQQAMPIGGFLGALPESFLVARHDELETVLGVLDSVAQGVGRLVMLSGEPGVGKTRLAQEVTLACRNRGFLVATGRCYESHQAMPYYPFFEALTSAFKSASPSVRFKVEDRWPVLGRLLPNQGIEPPPTSTEGAEEQQKLFWAVTGFIQEIARQQPFALLVDDLHWADASSLQLLEHLVRQTRGNRVLLLGTYRDVEVGRQHPLESALLDLRRERLIEDVRVRRMTQEGTAALISASVGEESISSEFAELVHSRSEGNAFFVEEVLRALVDRGDVYRENGKWERREIEEIQVPESIRAVIGQRLGRLQAESQDILREASVLGQTFDFEVLRAMNNRSEEENESALDEAIAAGLVREDAGDLYSFNHALTQQSLYGELSVRRRRRLHIAAGEGLENLGAGDNRLQNSSELAWHFIQGDDPQRALLYALKAGDEAEMIPAHGEAEQHFRTALELSRELGDERREVEALEKLGFVLGTTGKYDEALEVLELAAKQYEKSGDIESECRVTEWIGMWYRGRGTSEAGIERVRSLLARVEGKARNQDLAVLYSMLEFLLFAVGRYDEELDAAEQASRLAHGSSEAIFSRAEIGRGTALQMLSRLDEAREVFERIIPVAEAAPPFSMQIRTLNRGLINAGCGAVMLGDVRRGKDYFQRAIELGEQGGNPWSTTSSLINLVELHLISGDWSEARRDAERTVELSRTTGESWWGPYAWLTMGSVLLVAGDWEEATTYLHEALESTERTGDFQIRRDSQFYLARLDLLEGRPSSARDRLSSVIDRPGLEESGAAKLLPFLAESHLEVGDQDAAEATIATAIERTTRQDRVALVDALRVRAVILARKRAWSEAGGAFSEALEHAKSIPYPYAEASALYDWAGMERSRGDSATSKEKLTLALEIFEWLGAKMDIERTRNSLEELAS